MARLARRQGPEYQALAERLRLARRDAGMTQSAVASALGKPQSFVAKIESAERRLDVLELVALAKVYGKTLDFFLSSDR